VSEDKTWTPVGTNLEASLSGHYVDLRRIGDQVAQLFIGSMAARKLVGLSIENEWTHLGGDLEGIRRSNFFELRVVASPGSTLVLTPETIRLVLQMFPPLH